jgi:hypothetical protein
MAMATKNRDTTRSKSSRRNAVTTARSDGGGKLVWAAAGLVVVALVVAIAVAVTRSATRHHSDTAALDLSNPPATTAVGDTSMPPWPAPADATAAVRAAGLPMLATEGAVEHIHVHLDVLVDGRPVAVPAEIGIDQKSGTISPVHTHDGSGVIHIESPVQREFTLGEFFSEWGVSLSPDNIGGLRAGDGKTVRVFVNGSLRQGNPAAITFAAHDKIALVYGVPHEGDAPPAQYTFESGL